VLKTVKGVIKMGIFSKNFGKSSNDRNGQRTNMKAKTYADRDKDEGESKEDLRNGQGSCIYEDGSKYTGEFKDGCFIG